MDQLVRKQNPSIFRNHLHQVLLDIDRVVFPGQVQAPRNAMDVCIDYNT
jgi:hypothetical protein